MKNTNNSTQIKLLQAKIGITLSDLCSVLASGVNNLWARCFASFFYSKNLSEFGKILGSVFLKVWKDFKVSKERFPINFSSIFCSMECWQLQFNQVEEVCKLNISYKDKFSLEIKFNWLMRKKN